MEIKLFERESLMYCKCNGKVIFTRPFLMLDKVTFDEHVDALERDSHTPPPIMCDF